MNPPRPQFSDCQTDRRRSVRRPRATDGIGNALRQVYVGLSAQPVEMTRLLDQLTKD